MSGLPPPIALGYERYNLVDRAVEFSLCRLLVKAVLQQCYNRYLMHAWPTISSLLLTMGCTSSAPNMADIQINTTGIVKNLNPIIGGKIQLVLKFQYTLFLNILFPSFRLNWRLTFFVVILVMRIRGREYLGRG